MSGEKTLDFHFGLLLLALSVIIPFLIAMLFPVAVGPANIRTARNTGRGLKASGSVANRTGSMSRE